ncbi:MAG: ORF6N domain-containing protein, partial [Acidobacteriota bacterium]|nr:ORF6N domain-containing protein [Acidobacteriota bacterium]
MLPVEVIERRIYLIRGHKVMLDTDLATLYQVETRALNQAVRRNRDRFPEDFMFQLNKKELENWRSQIVMS